MIWEDYLAWRKQCNCIDCGKPLSQATLENPFATEIQCMDCWNKFGPPEKRGIMGAKERAELSGLKSH